MVPAVRFDLHCHSTCSDGALAPEAVAAAAAARGVEVFALTDHDTCAGTAAAVPAGARCVRAVEISCDESGRSVHVLAYDTGGAWHLLEDRLDGSIKWRDGVSRVGVQVLSAAPA